MKTKFLLLMFFAILAVQGWAVPVDSLLTRSTSNDFSEQWSGVELTEGIVLPNGISVNGFNHNGLEPTMYPEAVTVGAVAGTAKAAYDVFCLLNTIYSVYKWIDNQTEWIRVAYPKNNEVIVGKDYEFYIIIYGIFSFPLDIEYSSYTDAFDFSLCDERIFPEEIPSDGLHKMMKVKFHPSSPGDYNAYIKLSGNEKLEDDDTSITVHFSAVEQPKEHTIYISPSKEYNFYSHDGSPEYNTFTVQATGLTGPLNVRVRTISDIPYNDEPGKRFSIVGAGSWINITPEEAAQGKNVTVKYLPNSAGQNNEKIIISAINKNDAVSEEEILLHGEANQAWGSASLSTDHLTFTNAVLDYTFTQTFTVNEVNWTGDVTINLIDETGMFSYDSFDGIVYSGSIVHVHYTPTALGTHRAKINICGGNAILGTVYLIGTTAEPTITVTPSILPFNDVPIGEISKQYFTVKGTNLIGDLGPLTLVRESTGANCDFTIDKQEISVAQAAEGTQVTVTCIPTEVGNLSGRIRVSGGGATSATVSLIGNAIPALPTVSPESLTFTDVVVGDFGTDHFTVWGDFTSNLELTVTPATDIFSINKTVITPEQAASGQMITVTYRPVAEGTQTATITISGGGAQGTKTVSLTGTAVVREIKAEPAALTFSKQTVGVPVSQHFTVTATNPNAPLTLKLNDNTGMFSFEGSNSTIMTISAEDAANGAEVNVTYKPTAVGSHVASISITGGGALEEKIVMLSGSAVVRDINTTPSSWDFGNVALNVPKSRNIIIQAANLTGPLTLELTQRPNLGMYTISKTTITAAEAANGITVTVYYTPTAEGQHNATIKISGGDAPTKYVSITGTGVTPSITTSKTQLSFGTVVKNKTKNMTFTVTGTNLTSNLTLSSNNSYFTVSPTSISKEDASLGVLVTVTYRPTATGSHSGVISINSEGVTAAVNVSGTCVVPTITVSKTTLDFGNMDAGTTKDLTFKVTGTNVTGSISLNVASTDSHADFSISPSSLGASGGTVTVTCTANVAGSISGRVTVSATDAESKTVSLTGTVKCYITTNHSTLKFTPSSLNNSVKVTCVGANSGLSLALIGTDASYFRLGTTSISMADAREGKTVSVGCVPKTKTSLSATLKISGGGADNPKYVTLSYSDGSVSINSYDPDGEGGRDGDSQPTPTGMNELLKGAKVYAKGQTIIIESPVEQSAVISDIAGHAWSVDLQAGRNEIPVNASGVFIVRIREKTTKLFLK